MGSEPSLDNWNAIITLRSNSFSCISTIFWKLNQKSEILRNTIEKNKLKVFSYNELFGQTPYAECWEGFSMS
jgi:hypothetical protein